MNEKWVEVSPKATKTRILFIEPTTKRGVAHGRRGLKSFMMLILQKGIRVECHELRNINTIKSRNLLVFSEHRVVKPHGGILGHMLTLILEKKKDGRMASSYQQMHVVLPGQYLELQPKSIMSLSYEDLGVHA